MRHNCDGLLQVVERPRRGRVCRPAARVFVETLAGLLSRFPLIFQLISLATTATLTFAICSCCSTTRSCWAGSSAQTAQMPPKRRESSGANSKDAANMQQLYSFTMVNLYSLRSTPWTAFMSCMRLVDIANSARAQELHAHADTALHKNRDSVLSITTHNSVPLMCRRGGRGSHLNNWQALIRSGHFHLPHEKRHYQRKVAAAGCEEKDSSGAREKSGGS